MTLYDFYKKLQNHDWFYDFSDDGRVWREGREAEARLRGEARDLGPEYVQLFNDYEASVWSGPGFGTPKLPLPVVTEQNNKV